MAAVLRNPILYAAVLLVLVVAAVWVGPWAPTPNPAPGSFIELAEAQSVDPDVGFARERRTVPATGDLHTLMVFAQFRGEATAGAPEPSFAADVFDPQIPGSLTHFYDQMSFGQLRLTGTVAAGHYTSRLPSSSYRTSVDGDYGHYGRFTREVLRSLDADIDYAAFDNDGDDGIPNSGDDDGIVDYLFMAVRSTPRNFIWRGATGIGNLGFEDEYTTADTTVDGRPVRVSGKRTHGTIFRYTSFTATASTMAHEFGHALGMVDLYDLVYDNPEEDSAGIGSWGLMGQGTNGWNGDDGPNPLSAPHREWLGWLDDGKVVEIDRDTTVYVSDVDRGGTVYRVPVRSHILEGGYYEEEYFLLEYRSRANYYDRNVPAEGMLVWHVRPFASVPGGEPVNSIESQKVVDLVCADGLYTDRGFPLGAAPAPRAGRDNLDFWSHDATYRERNRGNWGDSTDVFDGVVYTDLTMDGNPSTYFAHQPGSDAFVSVALRNIRPAGDGLAVDIEMPRWRGVIREPVHWIGDVFVDGDLTLAPEGRLLIYDKGTRVVFAGSDRLEQGRDRNLCELSLAGDVEIVSGRLNRLDRGGRRRTVRESGIEFLAAEEGRFWAVDARTTSVLSDLDGWIVVRDSVHLSDAGARAGRSADVATAVTGPQDVGPAAEPMANYPNPFNSQTTITYGLSQSGRVQLELYNSLGQRIRVLVDEEQFAGPQQVIWDGRDEQGRQAASGVYFSRLQLDQTLVETRRMLLAR